MVQLLAVILAHTFLVFFGNEMEMSGFAEKAFTKKRL